MLSSILSAVAAVREWLPVLRGARTDRRDFESAALTALYTALNETRMYIASRDPGRFAFGRNASSKPRDEEAEARLSRLWIAASVQLRLIDHDLADRCFVKADYWAQGAYWPDDEVRAARIEIDRVFAEARSLL